MVNIAQYFNQQTKSALHGREKISGREGAISARKLTLSMVIPRVKSFQPDAFSRCGTIAQREISSGGHADFLARKLQAAQGHAQNQQ